MENKQKTPLIKLDNNRYMIEKHGAMRVDGMVFLNEELLNILGTDESIKQVENVACLPGIVGTSMAMPDIHWGYGFPIGGVAAFDVADGDEPRQQFTAGIVHREIALVLRHRRLDRRRRDLEERRIESAHRHGRPLHEVGHFIEQRLFPKRTSEPAQRLLDWLAAFTGQRIGRKALQQ